jgi:hypothetical protein
MIFTKSKFYYGINIDNTNFSLDFEESLGGGVLSATLKIGAYALSTFLTEVARALTEASDNGLTYEVTVDRTTRFYTISTSSNFDIITNGPTASISGWSMCGFTVDVSGLNSHESDSPVGKSYSPQIELQNYIDFEDYQDKASASISVAASGLTEVVSFGQNKFMECNISLITDIDQGKNGLIESNPNGVADLRDFMIDATNKGLIEFIPDRDNADIYNLCILDKTRQSRQGVGFRMYELYGKGLAGYYETKKLTFRELS